MNTECISKSRTLLRKNFSSRTQCSKRQKNSDFFQQLKSQELKSGILCSFATSSPCSRNKYPSVSTSGRVGRQELYPAHQKDASPAITIIPVPQAQRWHIPAIKWLQKPCQAEGQSDPDTSGKPAQTWDQSPWRSHLFLQMASESDLSPSSRPGCL